MEPYTTSFQSPLNNCEVSALGKPSSNSCCRHLGIARKGGAVSTLAGMVWGTFLEKNLPRSNGHLLDFRGSLNPCQDGLGHLCSEN